MVEVIKEDSFAKSDIRLLMNDKNIKITELCNPTGNRLAREKEYKNYYRAPFRVSQYDDKALTVSSDSVNLEGKIGPDYIKSLNFDYLSKEAAKEEYSKLASMNIIDQTAEVVDLLENNFLKFEVKYAGEPINVASKNDTIDKLFKAYGVE